MSEEEKALIRRRTVLKTRLVSLKDYLNILQQVYFQSQVTGAFSLSNTDFHTLTQRLTSCEPLLDEFNNIQSELEAIVSDESLNAHLLERQSFENSYFHLIGTAKTYLLDTVASRQRQLQNETTPVNLSNNQSSRFQLPKIKIPPFSGPYDQWLEFREMFKSMVHNRQDIDPVEKFHYLKTSLLLEAAEVIKSVDYSPDNYETAWALLCDRYDNNRILLNNHVKAIFNLPPIEREAAPTLRSLIDSVSKHLRALKALGQPTDTWDTLIIHIVATKLDSKTSFKWEEYRAEFETPTLDNLKTFLKNRADLLEALELSNPDQAQQISKPKPKGSAPTTKSFQSAESVLSCTICQGNHQPYNCEKLLKLSERERLDYVKQLKLCINCLKANHTAFTCKSGSCRRCNRKHNTLLHFSDPKENNSQSIQVNTTHSAVLDSFCILSTVVAQVSDVKGNSHQVRILLDSGSQSNFITEDWCTKLGLKGNKINRIVSGINEQNTYIKRSSTVKVYARHSAFNIDIPCLIIPKITSLIPSQPIDVSKMNIPTNVLLADPLFNIPDKIDILIGSQFFWNLLCIGQISLGRNLPTLQKTMFGWIVGGPHPVVSQCTIVNAHTCCETNELQSQLERFWTTEQYEGKIQNLSLEEQTCEELFENTTFQEPNGRFVVQIPLKSDPEVLGESKLTAIKRFELLERKLQRSPQLRNDYCNFMSEYESMGHMTHVPESDLKCPNYFIPHHSVTKVESLTTKLRVVFDASCKTNKNISRNEIEMVGPTLQKDLFEILLRFRRHKIAITADIAKMYRQVLIAEEQRSLQYIIWRDDPNKTLKIYQLNTVTYGTASASFLAIRSLHQVALNNKDTYPDTSAVILSDFYVDDLITGADSVDKAIELRNEISSVLMTANFPLRKWASNDPKVLENLTDQNESEILTIGKDQKTKTLGLIWDPSSDTFQYSFEGKSTAYNYTKRSILSCISQIFDPLGFLAPVIILAKMLIKQLWSLHVDWDESLPNNIATQWRQFCVELYNLNDLKIPRFVLQPNITEIHLHGFCDASQGGYGACIYVRCMNSNEELKVKLLCSKSKVAPSSGLTIPRLELCAAVLLTKLMKRVSTTLSLQCKIYYWSDSTVVLSWLKLEPSTLKTFVSNRVHVIQSHSNSDDWHYVQSRENPADLVSRGVQPTQIKESTLWWNGPEWLSNISITFSKPDINQEIPEIRTSNNQQSLVHLNYERDTIFDRYSKLKKLQRVFSYILRFVKHSPKASVTVSQDELQNSMLTLIKLSQMEGFPSEYKLLKEGKVLPKGNRLNALKPFFHIDETIRVGGRIDNSNFNFEKRHPCLLSSKHKFTKLIFESEHERLLHCGAQHLLYSVRERYWPLGGRNLAKRVIHKCIVCFKVKPRPHQAAMGQLPKDRVIPHPPFHVTGIDYAGPFMIKDRKGRGCKTSKAYISIFICFSTKCVHIELVTALSTEAFMLAFNRFVARRACPAKIYSDNGSNFIGAHNEMQELGQFLQDNRENLKFVFDSEIPDWEFIPAYSPHFGGLWEAGVKSTKHHLRRLTKNSLFTYEELYTLLVQIEGVLNSRPISPLSADPTDLNPLTPSHFLIGRSLTSLPERDLTEIPDNRLNNYQRIQQIRQNFWRRWSKEYVSELQTRSKWKENHPNLKVGEMVIIKEDNTPPLSWRLGRIETIFPGKDDVTRVACIRTTNGNITRAFTKICPLPLED